MIQFETKVVDIIQRTENAKSFRFKPKEGADFRAGQFFFVGIKVDGEERAKHFSFSNSPTEKGYIEFTKRITQSPFSKALEELKKGDWAKIKMPYGSFTLEGDRGKAAFLSGGIGITPIRSMCKFATDMKLPLDLALIYGNNKEEDIIFREDFDRMQADNKNLRVLYTLTSPDIDKNRWNGKTGYIDDKMIRDELPDFKDRAFYVCGPPKMVESMVGMIKNKLGIRESKIILENFTGY